MYIVHCMYTLYYITYFTIEQKGMTFDHDFGYSLPLFSSLLKKKERRKGKCTAKTVIKSHAFLLDLTLHDIVILKDP